jgi:hypothetical protein
VTAPLVEEALKKAAVAWVSVGDGPALALWCLPLEGSLVVVCGPGEQSAPGLAETATATVRLRGDTGGVIVRVRGDRGSGSIRTARTGPRWRRSWPPSG